MRKIDDSAQWADIVHLLKNYKTILTQSLQKYFNDTLCPRTSMFLMPEILFYMHKGEVFTKVNLETCIIPKSCVDPESFCIKWHSRGCLHPSYTKKCLRFPMLSIMVNGMEEKKLQIILSDTVLLYWTLCKLIKKRLYSILGKI